METHHWFLILFLFIGTLLLLFVLTCRIFAPI